MSVGSLVATNLLEALVVIGRERFFVISTDREPEAANNFACDVVYRVPPTVSSEAYCAALATIGKTEEPELWMPARYDDVLELAWLFAGQTLPGVPLVGSPGTAKIICDKWLSYRFAIERVECGPDQPRFRPDAWQAGNLRRAGKRQTRALHGYAGRRALQSGLARLLRAAREVRKIEKSCLGRLHAEALDHSQRHGSSTVKFGTNRFILLDMKNSC